MCKTKTYFTICLFFVPFTLFNFTYVNGDYINAENLTSVSDTIICRLCGDTIADATQLFENLSPNRISLRNDSIFGVKALKIQVLENPYGLQIEVITVHKSNCISFGDWQPADTWFPGYVWQPCICPHCGAFVGWMSEPVSSANPITKTISSKGFYGISLDSVLSAAFVDSLLVIPKL